MRLRTQVRCGAVIALGLFSSAGTAAKPGQNNPAAPLDPTALVRRAVQHRLDSEKTRKPAQYLIRRIDERHDNTKLIIETKDGDVARLVAVGGKPLSPEADKAEQARLDNLVIHPELQEHRRKEEQDETNRVSHILSLLPDGLLYQFQSMVACGTGQCYRLSFKPNPNFDPPDLEANILTAVSGEVWIDQAQERLVRLDAHFIKNVDFGFGLLFKLNKGGTVLLQQTNVGNDDWELTGLNIHLTYRILVLKSSGYQVNEEMTRYSPVAPMHYRDAIHLLKKYDPSAAAYTP